MAVSVDLATFGVRFGVETVAEAAGSLTEIQGVFYFLIWRTKAVIL